MKAKEVMELYNITRVTLSNWVKNGKIKYTIKPSGHYDYHPHDIPKPKETKTVIYARCSTTSQKENLDRQIDRLKSYASAQGLIVNEIYSEIGSALNYNRKKYRKLYESIILGQIDTLIIEYKDRILRIGFDDFNELCRLHNINLIIVDETIDKNKSKQQEIVEDMISIIHHFSSKMYSNRKRKKIIDTIKDVNS